MSLSDAFELEVLDAILGTSGLLPGTVYIALSTTTPTDAGANFTEPVGNAYARVAVTNNATQWPAAASAEKSNANAISFPTASGGNWGTVTHVGIFTAAGPGGTPKIWGALDAPRAVNDGDLFQFPANLLKLLID